MSSPQSIRDRLTNLARERSIDVQLTLTTYAIERTLYRLSLTPNADSYVLKGAQLLRQYLPEDSYRASRDGDLLAHGDEGLQHLADTILEAATLDVPDGLAYDLNSLVIDEIREGNAYAGLRARIQARLAGARLRVQLDVAFGDAVVPPPTEVPFRTLLDQPAPRLKGYAIETVVAEKLQAITSLGLINSRLKDYFDLWFIAQHIEVDPSRLEAAITATYERRRTEVDPQPPGLSDEYAEDAKWNRQWAALLRNNDLQAPPLIEICQQILAAFNPALELAAERKE
ncbi:MAG: nucleotidyl transferase AbiEii/AbiGii toxin family protein [Deinococcales bacterium]|jgi:predicted nucleotidyltransferase component of viral defense system